MSGRALGRGWASARDNWHGQRPASVASEHGGRRDGRAWSTRCERERPRGGERGDDGSETRRGTDGGAVTAGSSVPQASEDEDGDRAGARAEEGRRRGPHVRGEKGTTRPGEAVEEEDEEAGDEGGPTRWSDDDGRRRRVGAEELRAAGTR